MSVAVCQLDTLVAVVCFILITKLGKASLGALVT